MYDIKGWDPQDWELREFTTALNTLFKGYDLTHTVPILGNRTKQYSKVNAYVGSSSNNTYVYCVKKTYPDDEFYTINSNIVFIDGKTIKDVGIEIYYCNTFDRKSAAYNTSVTNTEFPLFLTSVYMNIKSTRQILFSIINIPFFRYNTKNRKVEIVIYDIKRAKFKSMYNGSIVNSKSKFYNMIGHSFMYSRFYAIGPNTNKLISYTNVVPLRDMLLQRSVGLVDGLKTGSDDNGCMKTNIFCKSLNEYFDKRSVLISFGNFEDNNYSGGGKII